MRGRAERFRGPAGRRALAGASAERLRVCTWFLEVCPSLYARGARLAASAPADLDSGGRKTRASGPRRTSRRSSQTGSLTASTTSIVPFGPGGGGLGRVRLDDPRRARVQLERDARVVGVGVEHGRDLFVARRGLEVLTRRTEGTDAIDAEHALVGGAVAVRVHVPLAHREERDRGVDAAGREVVAARRPVVDLDAFAAFGGLAHGREERSAPPPAPRSRGGRAPASSFAERGRERTFGIAARNREQRAAGGEERQTFRRA